MKKRKGKLFIGTSGWVYSHWEGIFYPEDLALKDKLKYFSEHFKTAEINYSFYHLPRPTTYENWYKQTPTDFIFAVKASRFITHIKRLKDVKDAWKTFLENALHLKEKLGPILFQFPPSFQATDENVKRLEDFLKYINNLAIKQYNNLTIRYAFEFRHKTWCDEKIYKLIKKYNAALVISNSPTWEQIEKPELTDFIYLRMHGSRVLFASKYTKKELQDLAQKIKKWQKSKDVYVYFNNDFGGYALENAKTLLKIAVKIAPV